MTNLAIIKLLFLISGFVMFVESGANDEKLDTLIKLENDFVKEYPMLKKNYMATTATKISRERKQLCKNNILKAIEQNMIELKIRRKPIQYDDVVTLDEKLVSETLGMKIDFKNKAHEPIGPIVAHCCHMRIPARGSGLPPEELTPFYELGGYLLQETGPEAALKTLQIIGKI